MKRKKYETEDDFFKIPNYNGCGIYAIVCLEDFSCYVGSTRNIKKRAYQHKKLLMSGKHTNKGLQDAHDKNRILRFLILQKFGDETEKERLLMMEHLHMLQAKYNRFDIYNKLSKKSELQSDEEYLNEHIVFLLSCVENASDIFINAIEKEYGSRPAYLRNREEKEMYARCDMRDANKTKN